MPGPSASDIAAASDEVVRLKHSLRRLTREQKLASAQIRGMRRDRTALLRAGEMEKAAQLGALIQESETMQAQLDVLLTQVRPLVPRSLAAIRNARRLTAALPHQLG